MKRLLWLLLLVAPIASAQQIICDVYTNAACNTTSNPGSGTQGEPWWKAFGKTNEWFKLNGIAKGTNGGAPTTASSSDIISLFTGCSGTEYLGADGACHAGGGGSMVYPGAGIPNSTGTAWGTSYSVTGTGNVVLSTSPTLVTPNLGTPSAINLTNATSLPCTATPALNGDVTTSAGSCATTVSKVNGASIPLSAAVAGTDASGHIIAATTTGTGSAVLASAPTIANLTVTGTCTGCGTGSSVTLQTNGTNNTSQTTLNVENGPGINCANPSAGNVQCSQSQALNAQVGTTYTIASTDASKLVTFNNAAAVAVTLPQATGSFGAGFAFTAENLGAGTVTITPTTSTINGASSLAIKQNEGCSVVSDGTNYQVGACTALVTTSGSSTQFAQGGSTFATASGTEYFPFAAIGALSSEGAESVTAPKAGTVKSLYVKLSANQAAGATLQVTLRDNAVSEAVTCTVAAAANTCSDTTDTFSFAQGDTLDWQVVQTGTGTGATINAGFLIQ